MDSIILIVRIECDVQCIIYYFLNRSKLSVITIIVYNTINIKKIKHLFIKKRRQSINGAFKLVYTVLKLCDVGVFVTP